MFSLLSVGKDERKVTRVLDSVTEQCDVPSMTVYTDTGELEQVIGGTSLRSWINGHHS